MVDDSSSTSNEQADLPDDVTLCVGIGSSAGGLEPLREFFQNVDPEAQLAYVTLQHLSPDHETSLPGLLAGEVEGLEVKLVRDGMKIQPRTIYVLPAGQEMTITKGRLKLKQRRAALQHTPIDLFFSSLAMTWKERCAACVLSGAGSDGTLGIRRIKEHGGLALSQVVGDAKYSAMPQSALATGLVDYVLPAAQMPAKLAEYAKFLESGGAPNGQDPQSPRFREAMKDILQTLQKGTSHDFSRYKLSTLDRRVQRRMHVTGHHKIQDYAQLIKQDQEELGQLLTNFLIGVTQFFRDKDSFEALRRQVIEKLVRNHDGDLPLRIWVVGCSTGEEAFTVAMLFRDAMEKQSRTVPIKIFATDIDENALRHARSGIYDAETCAHVPESFMSRYFSAHGECYRVNKPVRDMCVFCMHNVITDPPFARLNLLVCRNLLIYMDEELQTELNTTFHFSLNDRGFLFMSRSENLRASSLFDVIDSNERIFQARPRRVPRRRPSASGNYGQNSLSAVESFTTAAGTRGQRTRSTEEHLTRNIEQVLLDDLSPACLVVDRANQIRYYSGDIGKYLKPNRGEPSHDVVENIHPGLRIELRTALYRCRDTGETQHRHKLSLGEEDKQLEVDMEVRPLSKVEDGAFWAVVFREAVRTEDAGSSKYIRELPASEDSLAQQLEVELDETRAQLEATIKELEETNEELSSSNEELVSLNEELQTSNEELQSSREELQSLNEELLTLNSELEVKIKELDDANADLENLFVSTRIATIFLNSSLHITRFTPAASEKLRLIKKDIGCSLLEVQSNVITDELIQTVRAVHHQAEARTLEIEVESFKQWYRVDVSPYRDTEGEFQGLTLTFTDISQLKQSHEEREQLNRQLEERVNELQTLLRVLPVVVAITFDAKCSKVILNEVGVQALGGKKDREHLLGYELVPGDQDWHVTIDGQLTPMEDLPLQKAVRTGKAVSADRIELRQEGRDLIVHQGLAFPLFDGNGEVRGGVGVFSDITQLSRTVEQLQENLDRRHLMSRLVMQAYQQDSLQDTLDLATRETARAFGAAHAKILEYNPAEENFILRSSYGFTDVDTEDLQVPLEPSKSQAGYTLKHQEAVVCNDADQETRFQDVSILMKRHHVKSGISAVIPGSGDDVYGVLELHSLEKNRWTDADAEFLRNLAYLLAVAIQKNRQVEALTRSEEHFRQLAESLPLMVWTTDAEGQIEYVNSRFQRYTGQNLEDFQTRARGDTIHPEDRQRVVKHWMQCVDTGQPFEDEYRIRNNQGEFRWHLSRGLPVRDENGRIIRWFGSITDIEDWKRAEFELRDMSRRKDQFLAMLGHELRNPLSSIRNSIFVMQQDGIDPEQEEECRQIIMRQSNHLGRLVDDLLDVSRINKGLVDLDKQTLDLRDVLQEAVGDYRGFMEDKHLQVDVTVPEQEVKVLGDGTRLTQAFGNLLHNAAKFSSEHQKVEVKMTLPRNRNTVEISIRDYGQGMGEDTAQDLFKVLPRRQTFRQAGEAGLGLGLVVVRNLVELHGGEVSAESAGAGKGAVFTIILPLISDNPQSETADAPPSPARRELPQRRVLLIEDDLAAARSLELLISLEGQEVKMARTGREALEIAGNWKPDIVICDIRLPDVSGLELIGQIRELQGLKDARFVGLSGFSNADTRQEALEQGFDDYLVKPPSPERLFESLFPDHTR